MIQNPEAITTRTDRFNGTHIFPAWQKQKNKTIFATLITNNWLISLINKELLKINEKNINYQIVEG